MAPLVITFRWSCRQSLGSIMDKQIWMGKLLTLAFFIPLLIYLKTLLPGVGFWDTAEFQTIAHTFDIGHPTGYPTYVLIGKIFLTLFGFNSVAWRMNFLSSLFAASGIYLFSLSLFRLTKNSILSLALSLLLALNPYLWAIAIRADPHALHFLFTSIFLFLGIKITFDKKTNLLPLISFISGLSLGNHMLSIFFLPSLVLLFFLCPEKVKSFLAFLLGASIYLLLPAIYLSKIPLLSFDYSLATLGGLKRYVLGEDFQGLMNTWARENFAQTLKFYFDLVKSSFPYFIWLLIPIGIFVSFSKKIFFGLFTFLLFFLPLYFSLRYQNAVIERYFITSFAIGNIWLGVFLSKVIKPKTFITFLVFILPITLFLKNIKVVDQSQNHQAESWAKETVNSTEKDSVIFSWWSYTTPLWYFQKVEGVRKDIIIVNANPHEWEGKARRYQGSRHIYFIQEAELKDKNLRLIPHGSIFGLRSSLQP